MISISFKRFSIKILNDVPVATPITDLQMKNARGRREIIIIITPAMKKMYTKNSDIFLPYLLARKANKMTPKFAVKTLTEPTNENILCWFLMLK